VDVNGMEESLKDWGFVICRILTKGSYRRLKTADGKE
jgi:predicted RNA binding protein YcfA (HicA-like mRNA interferase family)